MLLLNRGIVLYGEGSNFLIDRQRDDPTKDQSQSNLGNFVAAEYCHFSLRMAMLKIMVKTDRAEVRGWQ